MPNTAGPSPTGTSVDTVAQRWLDAVWGTGIVPLSHHESGQLLRRLLDRILSAASAQGGAYGAVRTVGADLVHAHFTDDRVLGASIAVLGAELPGLGCSAAAVDTVVQAFCEGYQTAMRLRMERGQEAVRQANDAARRRADEAARLLRMRYDALLEHASIGIAGVGPDGRCLEANGAYARLLGRSPEELTRVKVTEPIDPDDADAVWDDCLALLRGEQSVVRRPIRFRHAHGHALHCNLTLVAVRGRHNLVRSLLVLAEDRTRESAFDELLEGDGRRDHLTYLPHREALRAYTARTAATRGATTALFVVGIDNFAQINERHGLDVGNAVLREVGEILGRLASRHMVARLGGDTFAVLLAPNAVPGDSARVAREAVCRLRETPLRSGGVEVRLTASVGVAEHFSLMERPVDPDALLIGAERAMRRAKDLGGDRAVEADGEPLSADHWWGS